MLIVSVLFVAAALIAQKYPNLAKTPPMGWNNWNSMTGIFKQQKDLARYAGPGKWNDPEMLEVGNGRMTTEEYRTHFSLWCMLASPLMAGNDLANMTPETKAILMNKEMIAIDQDTLGRQATL